MFYVYLLVSGEETYVGFSADLRRRLAEHQSGQNRSTRGRQWTLAYYEAYSDEHDARERERRLKNNGRVKRQLLLRTKRSVSGGV